MSPALVAANKSAIKRGGAETGRINPYLWVLDGLVSAITKTAYRGPENSSVQLKKYMMRWLKINLRKLGKKYKKYNGVPKVDTKVLGQSLRQEGPNPRVSAADLHFATVQALPGFIQHTLYANDQNADCQSDYYAVKGERCLQREDLMDVEVLRSHHLRNQRSRRISQPSMSTAVQVVRNVNNQIRPVVTNFHRTFANAFCEMQTAELKGCAGRLWCLFDCVDRQRSTANENCLVIL
nr:unnamed protein product [Spirometra erinaceieuropaei]